MADRQLRRSAATKSRYASAYFQGFIIALLLAWSPFKLLAYGAALLMLGWFIVRTRSKIVVGNLLLLILLWLVLILVHAPFIGEFAWAAALLTALTYSSFIPILVIPTRFLMDRQLFPRMLRWIAAFTAIEGVWGLVQGFYAFRQSGSFDVANGDAVEGTIHPWLAPELAFANPMFAANMTVLLLALLPTLLIRRKYMLAVILGLMSLILASVVHVLLFLTAAGILVGILYSRIFLRRWSSWLLVIIMGIGVLLAANLLSSNLRTAPTFVANTLDGRTPRGVVLERVLTEMPEEYPLMPWVGLGPGQFSSRAALIVTGQYFGSYENPTALPLVPVQMSTPMADYLWPEFIYARSVRSSGSTFQPASSWLSFYTEIGGIASVIVAFYIGALLLRIRRRASSYQLLVHGMALSIGILFVVFLGIQENYWEVPQAIFPGLLILKAMYAHFSLLSADRSSHLPIV